MDTGLGLSSQGAKVPYFFVPRKSACPLTHPPKFVRGCIFSPKSGKKQNTVLFYFSWNYFALQAVNFIGGALIKIKVKSCHCSTSFYPYLCCIFFWTITISFLYFPENCSNHTHSLVSNGYIFFPYRFFIHSHVFGWKCHKSKVYEKKQKNTVPPHVGYLWKWEVKYTKYGSGNPPSFSPHDDAKLENWKKKNTLQYKPRLQNQWLPCNS